jgi:hypothetical protein
MTDKIITRERIVALSHVSHWRGWTKRPYSVGEHTAVGLHAMNWFKRPVEQMRRWCLHDIHETEVVGDVPTPDKREYMNEKYFTAVEEFDFRLGVEAGCTDFFWWEDQGVKDVDWKILLVENDLIRFEPSPSIPSPDYSDPFQHHIRNCIQRQTFATSDRVIIMWNKLAYRFGWDEI